MKLLCLELDIEKKYINDMSLIQKYDDFTGRFFQIDPLNEKYYSWTPYHYSANNPVSFLDGNGMEFILHNLNEEQVIQWNANISVLKSWNSPTVNFILNIAESKDTKIYTNFFSGVRPVTGETSSNIGRLSTLEQDWNSKTNIVGGITLVNSEPDGKADIIFTAETMSNNMIDDKTLNPFAVTPILVIDEINHAISKYRDVDKEKFDHDRLFVNLWTEINKGILLVPLTIKDQIENKKNNP